MAVTVSGIGGGLSEPEGLVTALVVCSLSFALFVFAGSSLYACCLSSPSLVVECTSPISASTSSRAFFPRLSGQVGERAPHASGKGAAIKPNPDLLQCC